MKTHDRVVLIYILSVVGAGAFAFWRGKRGKELYVDMALHGAVVGTAANVVAWLASESTADRPVAVPVGNNPGFFGGIMSLANGASSMAKMSGQAKQLMDNIDIDRLYAPFSGGGVEVGPVPANEYTVNQKPNRK